jgi:hypothetical protein
MVYKDVLSFHRDILKSVIIQRMSLEDGSNLDRGLNSTDQKQNGRSSSNHRGERLCLLLIISSTVSVKANGCSRAVSRSQSLRRSSIAG